MEHEFIADIETFGSGGQMLDVVKLKDGKILLITDDTLVLYDSWNDFESDTGARTLSWQSR